MSNTAHLHHLALIPRDGFFCKDGRGWHTSASGRGHSLDWPWPSTIRGALTTASGRMIEVADNRQFQRKDWLTHHQQVTLKRLLTLRRALSRDDVGAWSADDRVWPVPADALWLEGREKVFRLLPSEPKTSTLGRKVGSDYDIAREKLWVPQNLDDNSKPRTAPRWLSELEFVSWLTGGGISADPDSNPAETGLSPAKRVQAHVGINPGTLTAEESILFAHDVIETLESQHEWAIGSEVNWPISATPNISRVGSDGRIAFLEKLSADLFAIPGDLEKAFTNGSKGLRLIVATPTLFKHGWLPDGFEAENGEFRGNLDNNGPELILRAAFVPRPLHISGWDMTGGPDEKGGPKPTARLVPPGAVYFFERADSQNFGQDILASLWLKALGQRVDDGFGQVVPGLWEPAKENEK